MGLTLMHTFKGDYGTDEQDEVVSNTLKILTHGIKDKKDSIRGPIKNKSTIVSIAPSFFLYHSWNPPKGLS